MKKIANSMGFDVTVRRRLRQKNLNFKCYDKNVPRRTSLITLRERKKRLIQNGEISVGEKIVPTEYEVMRIDPEGNMVSRKPAWGRAINDDYVME